jgi:hypothetical protein
MKLPTQRAGRRRVSLLFATLVLTVPLVGTASTASPALAGTAPRAAAAAAQLKFAEMWRYTTPYGKPIAGSSPTLAVLHGNTRVVVVGDRSGHLYALRLADGGRFFVASTGGPAIDSTASSVATGNTAHLYVGVGNSANAHAGYYWALDSYGRSVWKLAPHSLPHGTSRTGLQSSMTVATLARRNTVISGTMGQLAYAIESNTGHVQPGFPWFEADSNFATPGTMDPAHVGRDEIVMGGDSSAGVAYGYQYRNGGHIRILRYSGNAGTGRPGGGLLCQYNTNQVVQSSPAIGRFLRGGAIGIVAGTGGYFAGASDTNKLIAVDQGCHLRWKSDLHGLTGSSPALANVLGNGGLQIVQGTRINPRSGRVYALSGVTGQAYWSRALTGGVYGGITTADLTGRGYQDVIVPTTGGTFILDGKTGVIVGRIGIGMAFQNSALVTADSSGRIGITIAGYDWHNRGVVIHYRVDASNSSLVSTRGAWPMFHHDLRLSGNADNRTP